MNIKIYCIKILLVIGLLAGWTTLSAQTLKVSGIVSDQNDGMLGVSVLIKGTSTGTITDADGKYTINAKANSILVFSFIGYETQSVAVDGKNTLNLKLKEQTKELEDVVVIGYGTMKKRDITGSISSVSSKDIEKSQPINMASALQAKVSGLDIMSSSEPGSGSTYRIRGTSTLSDGGSTPLFIVDGMETENIDNINPRDIASVEVLKDAASTAIYGSKSANGVIIVSTKQGNTAKAKIDINYSITQSQIAKTVPQMNRLEGVKYETLRNYFSGSTTIANRDSLNPSSIADNYYQEVLFQKAYTHQLDISVSGSDKRIKYFISGGYLDEQGIQLNTYNKRLSTRINVDYKGNDKFTIGNRLSVNILNQRLASAISRSELLRRGANVSLFEPDGTYTPVLSNRPNPLASTMLGTNDYKIYDISLNEFLEYKILPDLKFKATISANLYQKNYNNFNPSILDASLRANSNNSNSTRLSWTQDDVFTYSKTFNNAHSFTAMGGFSLQESTTDLTQLWVTDNISDGILISNAFGGVNMAKTNATWTGNRMASFFGRGSYSYKGRYLFNTNIRYDGSSRFGIDKRWGLFPSASAGWRFSDESFMEWAKPILNDAKFRLSYGVTGNQTAGNFASYDIYTTSNYADYVGLSASQLSNLDLGWEQTNQINAGLDLSFFNNRLSLVVDYYKKKTSDVLYLVRIPQTNGLKTSYKNIGSVDNTGLEFTINSTNIKTKDFEWNTSLNLSFNKNVITSIPEGGQQILNDVYLIGEGYAVGTMYGWKRNAIFSYDQSNAFDPSWHQLTPIFDAKDRFAGYQLNGHLYTGEVKQLRNGSSSGAIYKGGDVMWDDVNKDGVIDANDRQVLGCGQPDLIGGFNTEFKYKNFTLSAFFTFAFGGDIFSKYLEQRSNYKLSAAVKTDPVNLANSWFAPGDVALFPKPDGTGLLDNTRAASNLWISEGSYIRLKNLRFGYEVPKKFLRSLSIESINVFAMMQNFFTWTNYKGFDPEIPSNGFSIGYDNNSYPKEKDILMGININF